MIPGSTARRRRPPPSGPAAAVVLGGEQHLGDRVVGAGLDLVHQVPGVGVQIGRARMHVRVGGDADREVAQGFGPARPAAWCTPGPAGGPPIRPTDQPGGSPRSARMLQTPTAAYEPITCRSSATEWPTAVRWATGSRVVSSAMRWVILMVRSPVRAACAVGDGDERRAQRFQPADGGPQHVLVRIGARRHELHREMRSGRGKSVADGHHARQPIGPGVTVRGYRGRPAHWPGGPGDACMP